MKPHNKLRLDYGRETPLRTPEAHGDYDDRFAPVIARFEEHLASTSHGGASLAVYVDGDPVIDVWGGVADITRGQAWGRDTLAMLFSCSKSVTTILALTLVERGVLDLDAAVSRYWPEFAANGKDRITVREVLSHRAGLPLVDSPLTFDDVCTWGPVISALESQTPYWSPGTAHAYHAITVGFLLGEVVRRITGQTLGEVLRNTLSEPLGLDLWIGLPYEHHSRTAAVLPAPIVGGAAGVTNQLILDDLALRAITMNGALDIPVAGVTIKNSWNEARLRNSELPAANAMSTARSLAKLHAALVSNVNDRNYTRRPPLLSKAVIDDACWVESEGPQVIGAAEPPFPKWGTGFMLPADNRPMLGVDSFGHDGAAGGLCFADSGKRLGFAFVPSVFGPAPDRRVDAIVDELRTCLER